MYRRWRKVAREGIAILNNMVKVGYVEKVAFAFTYLEREQYSSKSMELLGMIM